MAGRREYAPSRFMHPRFLFSQLHEREDCVS